MQLVDIIGSVLQRRLRYHEVPAEMVRQRFVAMGFSAAFADAYLAMLATTLDQPATVTDEIRGFSAGPRSPSRNR